MLPVNFPLLPPGRNNNAPDSMPFWLVRPSPRRSPPVAVQRVLKVDADMPPFLRGLVQRVQISKSPQHDRGVVVNQNYSWKCSSAAVWRNTTGSLFHWLLSRSLPSKAGNFCTLPSSGWVWSCRCPQARLMASSVDCCTASGYFFPQSWLLLVFDAQSVSAPP